MTPQTYSLHHIHFKNNFDKWKEHISNPFELGT